MVPVLLVRGNGMKRVSTAPVRLFFFSQTLFSVNVILEEPIIYYPVLFLT